MRALLDLLLEIVTFTDGAQIGGSVFALVLECLIQLSRTNIRDDDHRAIEPEV